MLSRRLPPHADLNALSRAVANRRTAGLPIVDLTEANPTQVGITYPFDLLRELSSQAALRYDPHPLGLRTAREAVARDYGRRGVTVDPDDVMLTASTSEAYAWLFKLLCDPGDVVLVPRPSYPLFEHLTALEGIRAVPFDLEYHARWEIDFATLDEAPDRTRALIVVTPNNPTGSYVTRREAEQLFALCRTREWALIADEVFADYPLEVDAPYSDLACRADVLAFSLGGLSKTVGLPQLKLAWLVSGGPPPQRSAALAALELIADSFLSVGTPVQVATPNLLEGGASIRAQIQERVRENLAMLREVTRSFGACAVLKVEGGWSAIIRVPATRSEDQLILGLLDSEGIVVHPGYFFDFPREAFVVISLLPPTATLRDAATRLLRYAVS
jgi:alanine-synthesizing transaminase